MIDIAGHARSDYAPAEKLRSPEPSRDEPALERRAFARHVKGSSAGGGIAHLAEQGEMRRALELAANWLWRDGRPRAVIARDRAVLWCNPAARRALVAPSPLVIRRNYLCPAKGIDIDPVDAFLAEIDSDIARLQVIDPQSEHSVLLTAWSETIDGAQAAFIEFGMRELPFDCEQSGMARAFGLTKAECRVIDAMAMMEPPVEIAARLGVSVHTIRTHIRRIYGKLAVRSQLQLMRLTTAYCGG